MNDSQYLQHHHQLIKRHSETDGSVIIHYGTPGQKWGKRLYQNKDGSLTALGRIHYGIGKRKEAQASKKAAEEKSARAKDLVEKRRQQNEVTKAIKDGASREEIEALIAKYGKNSVTKTAVKASNDPDFVNRHRDKLTNAEINEKVTRFQAEQNLSRYATVQKETPAQMDKQDDYKQKIIQSGDPETVLRNAKSLSSAELKEAKERISQLKEIRGMTMAEVSVKKSPAIKKGSALIKEILAPAAKEQAKNLASAGMRLAGKKIIESVFEDDKTTRTTLLKAIGMNSDEKAEADRKRASEVEAIIRKGDINEILKNANKMTSSEIENANKRINTLKNWRSMVNSGKKKKN